MFHFMGKCGLGILVGILFLIFQPTAFCQMSDADTLEYANDTLSESLSEKDKAKIQIKRAFRNSLLPGLSQVKNKEYWKVPVIYGGFGVMGTLAWNHHQRFLDAQNASIDLIHENHPLSFSTISASDEYQRLNDLAKDHRMKRNIFVAGVTSLYFLNLVDGIHPAGNNVHSPYKAALYSALIPGLGQIYNGEWWKVPLVYVGFGAFGYFIDYNNSRYQTYKEAYLLRRQYKGNRELLKNVDNFYASYTNYSDEAILKNKERWKRYRDEVILATAAFYGINIIDALVFAYMKDYNVSDDLSLDMKPLVLPGNSKNYAMGIQCSIRF